MIEYEHTTLYISLADDMLCKLKQPFDDEFSKLLESAAVTILKKWFGGKGYTFTHQYGIIISLDGDLDFDNYEDTIIISFITAYVNKHYSKFLVFCLKDISWDTSTQWEIEIAEGQAEILKIAESAYEMFVENSKLANVDEFFPGVGYTSFDKTPESYRHGTIHRL